MKASSSKASKVEEYDEISNEDSFKEEEMSLFIKRYNTYIKKHQLKHSDKNLINFKKTHPHKNEENKKEDSQLLIMNVENMVITILHVQAKENTTTRKRNSPTRRRIIIPKVEELITLGKRKMKVILLLIRVKMIMNMKICA